MIKSFGKFLLGTGIMLGFYAFSYVILRLLHIMFPPAILGLLLFAISLICGIIKEDWIKTAADWYINNLAMFLVPFWGGLIVYQELLQKNWISILLVIFITTTLTIVCTGLFVENGMKYLRLYHMRRKND